MPWADDLRAELRDDAPPPALDDLARRALTRRARRERARLAVAGVAAVVLIGVGALAVRTARSDDGRARFTPVGARIEPGPVVSSTTQAVRPSTTAGEQRADGWTTAKDQTARIVEPAPAGGYPAGSAVTVEVHHLSPGSVFHVAVCPAVAGPFAAQTCDEARTASAPTDATGVASVEVAVPAVLVTPLGGRACGACRLWIRTGVYPAAFGDPGLPAMPVSGTAIERRDLFLDLPVAG